MNPTTDNTPAKQPEDTNAEPAENLVSPDLTSGLEPETSQAPDVIQPSPMVDAETAPLDSATPSVEPTSDIPTTAPAPVVSPVVPKTSASPAGNGADATPSVSGGGRKRRWLVPVAVVVVLVLLGGGYVFGMYLPNRPASVYKKGLSNTASGYDRLVDYAQAQSNQHIKGYKADGNFKLTGSGLAGDGTITGRSDSRNATATAKLDIMGQKFTANARIITASGQTSPDIYLQLNGIKTTLDNYGLNGLDSLDGQWLLVDHTLLASAAGSKTGSNMNISAPTANQVHDALIKVGTVNRDYLFSTKSDTAVLTNKKYLGTSTQNGRKVYGYDVGYNKAHLKAYVGAVGQALDSSSLNDWAKKAYNGTSLSKTIDVANLQTQIDTMKSGSTFKLYIDAKTKLISSLQLVDPSDNSTITISQGYTGGSVYPFSVAVTNATDSNGSLKFGLNTKTNTYTFDFSVSPGSKATDSVTASGHFTVTPTNQTLQLTAPTGAKPISDVLNQLGLGSLSGQTTADPTAAAGSGLFTLTQ